MVAMSYKNSVIYFNDVVIWNEHIPREWPFTRKARMIRNQIKLRDISSHILDDLNLNIRRREKLKVTQTTLYLLKMALTKSANDSFKDTHTLQPQTHRDLESSFGRDKIIQRLINSSNWRCFRIKVLWKEWGKTQQGTHRRIFWRRRWKSAEH